MRYFLFPKEADSPTKNPVSFAGYSPRGKSWKEGRSWKSDRGCCECLWAGTESIWEHEKEEHRQEEHSLRKVVDPNFEDDKKRGEAREACHRRNPRVFYHCLPFGHADRAPGFKYPEHSPPLPNEVTLQSLAKFGAEDRVVLDASGSRPLAVRIDHVALGDRACARLP